MAENSKIEWCHHTFNPWVGCTALSPACDHCYAEAWAKRTGHPELWRGERRRTSEVNWRAPLKWNSRAAELGVRQRVFCASLADVFDNQVPPEWRIDLWRLIDKARRLDWMLLTKRPENVGKMLPPAWPDAWQHVWVGTTVEDAERKRRIEALRRVPAAVRFLSCEPLLGHLGEVDLTGIDLVICGGESGPHARPMYPDWARSLRDQCAAAGVAFFFKQWGEWRPSGGWIDGKLEHGTHGVLRNGKLHRAVDLMIPGRLPRAELEEAEGWSIIRRVGKVAAGRLLDGVEHNGMPQVRP